MKIENSVLLLTQNSFENNEINLLLKEINETKVKVCSNNKQVSQIISNSLFIGDIYCYYSKAIKLKGEGLIPLVSTTTILDNSFMKENYRSIILLTRYEANSIQEFFNIMKEEKKMEEDILFIENKIKENKQKKDKEKINVSEENVKLALSLKLKKAKYNEERLRLDKLKYILSYTLSTVFAKGEIIYFNEDDLILVVEYVRKDSNLTKVIIDNFKHNYQKYNFKRIPLSTLVETYIINDLKNNVDIEYKNAPEFAGEMALMEYEQILIIDKFNTINLSAPEVLSPIKNSLISSMIATASNGTEGIYVEKDGYRFLFKAAMIPYEEKVSGKIDGENVEYKEKSWKPFTGIFEMDFKNFKIIS